MKQLLSVCAFGLALCAPPALQAQSVNKTYENPGDDLYAGEALLSASWGDVYLLSHNAPSQPAEVTYITRTDNMGNLIKNIQLDDVNYKGKLIETSDGGILFASYQHSGAQLGIFRFDAALNLTWSKYIPIGVAAGTPILHKVDIETVPQSDTDHYMISCASATYISPYINTDAVVSLVYIDRDGKLMWHKKYADVNRAGSGLSSEQDLPTTISSIPVNGGQRHFLVGGTREEAVLTTQRSLFFLMVDQMGNVINPYTKVTTAGANPDHPDLICDTKKFTCAFRDAGASVSGDPQNISGIGVMNFAPTLVINSIRYFWQPQISEHWVDGLSFNSAGDYIIGGHAGVGNPNNFETPSLLKLSAATLLPSYYKRYNILHYTHQETGFLHVDGNDYSYISATPYPDAAHPNRRLRLIKADPAGDACGAVPYTISHVDYQPSQHNYAYQAKLFDELYDQFPDIHEVFFGSDVCDPAGNPGTYSGKTSAPSATGFFMSPTLLGGPQEQVQCNFRMTAGAAITISIYNSLGQLLHQETTQVSRGPVQLSLMPQSWRWAPGINIVQASCDGRLVYTGKIVRL